MNQLLDLAVEAHGGLERWRAIERLEVSLSCSGFSFLRMKGYPEGLPNITARIKMRRQPLASDLARELMGVTFHARPSLD